jgi:sec-independent protein translocase protein TatA
MDEDPVLAREPPSFATAPRRRAPPDNRLRKRRDMPNIGLTEILIIVGILILLFGASRLPKLGKSAGQGLRGFKDGLQEGVKEDPDEKKVEDKETKTVEANKAKKIEAEIVDDEDADSDA